MKRRETVIKVAFRKKGGSWFSWLIRAYTGGPLSHSEILFPDGRSFSSDESDGGTKWRTRDMTATEWDFLTVPCTEEQVQRVVEFCNGEDGCEYDKTGIAFSFLPIALGYQSSSRWFCSEICVAALQQVGFMTGYTPSRISPNKLYKILKKELEGK
jgi:hypothetical protein